MITEIMSNEAKDIKSPSLENYKNIQPENPMSTGEANDFWKAEFQNAVNDLEKREIRPKRELFYTSFEDRVKNTNLDASEGGLRGTWDGERGNSTFQPSYYYMKKTLKKYGIDGIDYINGEADFSRVAEATVTIGNMTPERYGKGMNFDQANSKLAEQFNASRKDGRNDWTAGMVEDYRIAHKLTWHERCDCKTMDLVPTKIHGYFKHSGGVAECKVRDGIGGQFDE